MRYHHIRGINVDLSAITAGGWPAGDAGYGPVTEKECVEAFHAMFDHGVNCIDTAPDYGNGHSEEVVGKALQGMDRSKVYVATKVGASACTLRAVRTGAGYRRDGRYENVLYECEQSLRRLGTDYIDFYFVHWPDADTPFSETMEAMKTLKQQGKIRFVGLSNFHRPDILTCENVCKIDAIQPPFSMLMRGQEELLRWSAGRGAATFTYGSLGGGILTGAFREPPTLERWDPRNYFYPFFRSPRFEKVMQLLRVMDGISAEVGRPVSQVAINWQTAKPFISTALCGVRNAAEAIENCGAFDWELTGEQIAAIDAAIAAYLDFDGEDKKY